MLADVYAYAAPCGGLLGIGHAAVPHRSLHPRLESVFVESLFDEVVCPEIDALGLSVDARERAHDYNGKEWLGSADGLDDLASVKLRQFHVYYRYVVV